jgi:hypothetical protein
MADSQLRQLWAELESDLQALVTEFPESEAGHAARVAFEEFLAANELGLALETLCDALLDSELR